MGNGGIILPVLEAGIALHIFDTVTKKTRKVVIKNKSHLKAVKHKTKK